MARNSSLWQRKFLFGSKNLSNLQEWNQTIDKSAMLEITCPEGMDHRATLQPVINGLVAHRTSHQALQA
jgi:hypothetical protein